MPSRRPWMRSLVISASLVCSTVFAQQSSVIGAVYPIKEKDALAALKNRAEQVDWQAYMANRKDGWKSNLQRELPIARKNLVRFHRPFYTVEQAVIDQKGAVIYPVGFRYNPLNHVRLPYRIVAISTLQVEWVRAKLRKTDRVLISHGDVFKARELLPEHIVFTLDERTRSRLDIQRVPTIVVQKGNLLEVSEYKYVEGHEG
ncbi:hypothetical protein [Pseudoalteromonas luteoviolacea]|uniref:hypothetical protein n=1 Tax=Pseudoalteromonas luteoviolacea TaxID=43657 RepID=UPI001B390572|nr:hypothetical protein [Pseudoalteromonas luteoviolacea]MBQ4839844.1 hypothetical protein [Pseudoalteromonas luteoviolacea]